MTDRAPLQTVVRKRWTRREWLAAASLGAAASGIAGLGLVGQGSHSTERTTGTCRFCLMRCGIECVVRDGRLIKVEGDLRSRTRGFLCEHGFALRELVHSDERVRFPLLRRGDAFHEVSWDEALTFVALRLAALSDRTALGFQTGWPFVRHPFVGFLQRFAFAFGTPNVATVSSLCEASLRMGQALTVGSKYSVDLKRVKSIVVWGANPSTTAPPFAHLVAAKTAMVIDPLRTTLARDAPLHLQPLPGTDGALALGLIHLVLQAGPPPSPERFHGLDSLAALAAQFPVERVVQLTSVPEEKVRAAATVFLTQRPLGIWQGLGVEHHVNGLQTVRALSALEALCGRFENSDSRSLVSPPGPNFHDEALPALYRLQTPSPAPPELTDTPSIGQAQYPLFERYNREAQGESFADAIDAGQLKALVLWGSNALITSGTLARAAKKLELLITVDPFFSASAQRSDVVLPACTFAESPDVDGTDTEVAARSLVPVQGASKPDFEVLSLLARACGLGQWFPSKHFSEAMRAPRVEWRVERGHRPRAEASAEFGTPTGKVELHSTVLEEAGHEPLPVWTPPRPVSADFPLWLVSGPRPRARINSQFAQSPSVRARMPEPEALLHPRHGFTSGERVTLESPDGRMELRAVATDDVHPDVVVVPAGWAEANPNALLDGERDPVSGFPAFRSQRCRLSRAAAPRRE